MSVDELSFEEPEALYESKRNALLRHMSIVVMVVSALYSSMTLIFDVSIPTILFIGTFAGGAIAFGLNHLGYHNLSKILGLSIVNGMVFMAASSESLETNIFVYFGATALAAMVIFGHRDRWKGLVFVLMSTACYLSLIFFDLKILPYRDFSSEEVKTFFVINVTVYTYVCVYILWTLLRTNYLSERVLQERNERIKIQNSELVKANAELDRFMYSTSHDMRAPLSSLTGLIKLSEISPDPTEVRSLIKLMKGSVRNLEKFTLDITDHYRNAKTEVVVADVDLKHLVDEVIKDLSFLDTSNEMEFQVDIPDDTTIQTDVSRLQVVLSNIVSNSIKYQKPQDEPSRIKISYFKKADRHVIEVEDNGVGIEQEHLDKVFDMFYRASSSSKGSGLGLYIVKETMGKLGGNIYARSVYGLGTTIVLELPSAG
ncbi:MAG: HAMP domain-containing sensor histidine kinase [Cyclobacteriaceae bacterium]|nr:HAMP domain-containing histidine kinase [Cyclobacteriaceae bacterium]